MRQFFSKFSRRTWIIIGVVAAVIVIAAFFAFSGGGEEPVLYQTLPVEQGDLAASVGATGSVRARQTAVLTWQTNGIVGSVNAVIGDDIPADFELASLDKTSLSQGIILAEADLVSAERALEDLLESNTALLEAQKVVDRAEEAYKKAYNWRVELNGKIDIKETYYDQFGNLRVKEYRGLASAETIEDADRDLALAESKLEDARRDYERLLQGEDSAEVAAARSRVEGVEASLKLAKLTAPFNGTVTQASQAVGGQVVP